MLIAERLTETARLFPDREAVVCEAERLSWRELDERAARMAGGLRGLGVQAGDFVVLQLPNGIAYLVAFYGALRIGATVVPANPRYPLPELLHILQDCQAAAIVLPASGAQQLQTIRGNVPTLRHVLAVDGPAVAGNSIPLDAWLATQTPFVPSAPPVLAATPATCLYTAGTTGRPKGALLSHAGLLWDFDQARQRFAINEHDRCLCVLPLFHSYAQMACLLASVSSGAALVILPQFRPEAAIRAVATERISVFPAVPAHFGALLSAIRPDTPVDFRSLRVAVTGGAAMPPPVLHALQERYGISVLEGNGPTEAGPLAYLNPEQGVRKPGSVGLPVPGVQVRIADAQDAELPRGTPGEVLVRGPNVMVGYLNQPEQTRTALRNGWLHTGDLGLQDEDGYVFLIDRLVDLILVGGLNVYPQEVERALLLHPAVADAAVVGAPDTTRGDRVVAFVVFRPGAAAAEQDVIRYCRTQLAPYKCPRTVLVREELPRNAAGKINKAELRVLAQEHQLSGDPRADGADGLERA